jgi:hypothetical protein
LWKKPKKRMEDRWEYADAVVRGEREKGRCGTLKRRGGRDTHSARVGDWTREKYTRSAQVDYCTTQRVIYRQFAA